jgi:hypothetical protein
VNRNSGKALDVAGVSSADGAAVTQWDRHDGTNQQFQFVDSGDGYYRIKARHSGKVLDVSSWSTADGAAIHQWTDGNGANQQFRLADSDSGYVRLVNRNSGKAAEVQNASTADGVVQYSDWGGTNQQCQLVRVDGGSGTCALPSLTRVAVKSRSTRSAGLQVSAAGRVVRGDLSRSKPRSPLSRMSRSTVHRTR